MRVDKEPAYVLHKRAYRESSNLLEVFTPSHGRVGLVHKGGRRLKKGGGVIQPFNELALSWTGRGELFTLTRSDVTRVSGVQAPFRVICGLYLNELILNMMPRMLPSVELYRAYASSVSMLKGMEHIEPLLRRFELILLSCSGYGLQLHSDAEHGLAIDPQVHYTYDCTRGPIKISSPDVPSKDVIVSGRTLIWLRTLNGADKKALQEAKRLLRRVIDYHLQNKPLHTRSIMGYLRRNH
ncbi:MAG: DNA repair protein RecO [Pseudomonadota bacterium]